MEAAREVCGEYLEGVTTGFRRGDDTEFQDRLFEYAACMRENGYDMDDPDFSEFGPSESEGDDDSPQFRGPFGQIDPNDPDFISAQEACEELLGGVGPGRGFAGRAEGGGGDS